MRKTRKDKLIDWETGVVSYMALPITYPLMLWQGRNKTDDNKIIKYK